MFFADGPIPVPAPAGADLMALLGLLGHSWLLWVVALVVIWLSVTRIAETYESAAKFLGPLGRHIAKRFHARDEKYRKRVAEEAKLLALELVPKIIPADYDAVRGQLKNVVERVSALEEENASLRSYVIYDEEWHFALVLNAAREGDAADFPPRLTWLEFREKWRAGWRPAHYVTPEAGPLAQLITEVGDAARGEAERDNG